MNRIQKGLFLAEYADQYPEEANKFIEKRKAKLSSYPGYVYIGKPNDTFNITIELGKYEDLLIRTTGSTNPVYNRLSVYKYNYFYDMLVFIKFLNK